MYCCLTLRHYLSANMEKLLHFNYCYNLISIWPGTALRALHTITINYGRASLSQWSVGPLQSALIYCAY